MPEYRTPGVYIEEISTGPRPVAASSTTDTGFVGVITLPANFLAGRGPAAGMFLPATEEKAMLAWNRALAFRPLLTDGGDDAGKDPKAKGKPAAGNDFEQLVSEVLPGNWKADSPSDTGAVVLRDDKGNMLRIPARKSLLSVAVDEKGATKWDLAFGANQQHILELIAGNAVEQGIGHTGTIAAVDPAAKPQSIDIGAIQKRMQGTAPAITGMDGFDAWLNDFANQLFKEILVDAQKGMTPTKAELVWRTLGTEAKKAWIGWLRNHPGMKRYELSVNGFFANGGKTAYLAVAIQQHGAAGPDKRRFLEDSFDGASAVAMLAAPGLEFGWQQAIHEYAGPRGRGDLFAVLETPRYLLTKEPFGTKLDQFRWTEGDSPYEVGVLETVASPAMTELRFNGYSADALLDRCVPRDDAGYGAAYAPWLVVDNPSATGPHDKYIIVPPSGHVAGVIAATDLKAGGGVHKAPANEQMVAVAELTTNISDKEQGALNMKGINIIRHRPGAGIRIWGARTTAADALWMYINVRRLFLFVERSVRDAVQWAVFLPNSDSTRSDLKTTISSFLYSLWNQGMLDGQTWDEAFSVQCDRQNNPDVDVRSGILTVDVQIRPLYPAEFIRIRFSQAPMQTEAG
ncbi:MAG: phage tail sheath subtilisin-like domain-containing protein [Myxococcota bacterium]|nr:phage tail sheath subtilisin-like domain-containing protein [Myxococcota bacterium]